MADIYGFNSKPGVRQIEALADAEIDWQEQRARERQERLHQYQLSMRVIHQITPILCAFFEAEGLVSMELSLQGRHTILPVCEWGLYGRGDARRPYVAVAVEFATDRTPDFIKITGPSFKSPGGDSAENWERLVAAVREATGLAVETHQRD